MTTHSVLRRPWFGGLLGLCGLLGIFTVAQAATTPITACGTLDQSGTYVLQDNLTTTDTCLTIDADFVTLNLNGFTLTGGGSGSGAGITCNAGRQGMEVRNGTVQNFFWGINAQNCDHSRISGVRVMGTTWGIIASINSPTGSSVISGCMALNNAIGLRLGYGTIRNSIANNNTNRGLLVDHCPTLLLGNVMRNNTNASITFLNGSVGCVDFDNIMP